MIELRLRGRIAPEELEVNKGKILGPADYNLLLTGPCRVYNGRGKLLAVYLPRAIPPEVREASYPILTTIRNETYNRGLASGALRIPDPFRGNPNQSYARPVMSSIVGSIEPMGGRFRACRLTAWTGVHLSEFQRLRPFISAIAEHFRREVPERYANQMRQVEKTHPAWVIAGTPFSTITVNNSYATGVHLDDGDLPEGYSCLAVLRRGEYHGGIFILAEYRVGVDLQDGDLLLMDAHEWHGNTDLVLDSPDAERISVVLYYRTRLVACGSPQEEIARGNAKGRLEE